MRVKGAQVSIAAVCLIVGIMFAVQYKTTGFYKQSLVPKRIEDLSSQLNTLMAERDAVEAMVNTKNQQLEDIRNSDKVMADLQKELQAVNMAGGLYPVEGAGISITIGGGQVNIQSEENKNGSIEDQNDLLLLVNDLRASRAEAIAVNDQRITAMSEIRWTGTMMTINGKRISPPYKILAIGDPNTLESGMSLVGGNLYTLKFSRQIDFRKVDNIKLPAFNGPIRMVYGKPVK